MKRQANFEILRVLAMAMIVAMHYMLKGGIAIPMSHDGSLTNHVAWLIEAFCIIAANCYVLISGYFMVEAEWKRKKLISLVAQVLFYSLLIPIVCLILGIGDVAQWTVYEWIFAVLPLPPLSLAILHFSSAKYKKLLITDGMFTNSSIE